MFTSAIGKWSYYLIAVAAFSTMFSTTITVVDGYGRAITRTAKLLQRKSGDESRTSFVIWTVVISFGSFLIINQYLNDLTSLVDLATILSFVVAPLAGYLNYKVIYSKEVGPEYRPSRTMKWLAIAGLIFLSAFTVIYFITLFNPELVSNILG